MERAAGSLHQNPSPFPGLSWSFSRRHLHCFFTFFFSGDSFFSCSFFFSLGIGLVAENVRRRKPKTKEKKRNFFKYFSLNFNVLKSENEIRRSNDDILAMCIGSCIIRKIHSSKKEKKKKIHFECEKFSRFFSEKTCNCFWYHE